MDWEAPAIVLDARPYGEGDAIATVMTEDQGLHRGLARGGGSRAQAALWQPGNLAQVRWVARLADQLGSFSAEMIHAGAAAVMDDALALAMLSAVCAVAEGALPEREQHPRVFHGLVRLVAHLPRGAVMLSDLIRWETVLLSDLGYGLDLTACAVTGETSGLAFVSPRTGRAVTEAAAGIWKPRTAACACRGVPDRRRQPAGDAGTMSAATARTGAAGPATSWRATRSAPSTARCRRRARCYTTASPHWRTNSTTDSGRQQCRMTPSATSRTRS